MKRYLFGGFESRQCLEVCTFSFEPKDLFEQFKEIGNSSYCKYKRSNFMKTPEQKQKMYAFSSSAVMSLCNAIMNERNTISFVKKSLVSIF